MILRKGKYYQKFGILESIHPDNHSGSVKLIDVDITLELKYPEFSKIKENIVLWYSNFIYYKQNIKYYSNLIL